MNPGLKLFIDTECVIAAVTARENIWNPFDEDYKNKGKRALAWTAVCHEVLNKFSQYSDEDQRVIEKRVQQRWRTARDCFVKARTRPEGAAGAPDTPYVFMEQLAFLETTLLAPRRRALTCLPAPVPDAASRNNHEQPAAKKSLARRTVKQDTAPQLKPVIKSETSSADAGASAASGMSLFERQLLAILKKTESPLEVDDECFFRSLAPILTTFDPKHKLLFRNRVLATALEMQEQSNSVFLETGPMQCCDVNLQEDEPSETKYRPPYAESSSDADDSSGPH